MQWTDLKKNYNKIRGCKIRICAFFKDIFFKKWEKGEQKHITKKLTENFLFASLETDKMHQKQELNQ